MAQGLKVGEPVSLLKTMSVSKDDPAYQQGLKRLNAGKVGQVVAIGPGHSMVVEFNGKRITLPSRRLDRVQAVEAEPTTTRTRRTTRQENETPARDALNSSGTEVAPERTGVSAEQPVETEEVARPAKAESSQTEATQQPASPDRGSAQMGEAIALGTPTLSSTSTEQTLDPNLYGAINYHDRRFITAVANTLLVSRKDPETLLIQLRFRDLPPDTQRQVEALIRAKLALGLDVAGDTASVEQAPKRRGRPPTKPQNRRA